MELNKKNYIANRDPLLLLTSYKQQNINTIQRMHDQRIYDQRICSNEYNNQQIYSNQQINYNINSYKVIFKGKRLLK